MDGYPVRKTENLRAKMESICLRGDSRDKRDIDNHHQYGCGGMYGCTRSIDEARRDQLSDTRRGCVFGRVLEVPYGLRVGGLYRPALAVVV